MYSVCITNLFKHVHTMHNYKTRDKTLNYFVMRTNTSVFAKSFVPSAINLRNALSANLKSVPNLHSFQRILRREYMC